MATTTGALNLAQLDSALAKLATKLARQNQSVKDTEAHIAALQQLRTQVEKAGR